MILSTTIIIYKRELTEWFKVISLKLIWFNRSHPFESDILCLFRYNKYGLEPGWLGASFGLRNCYVRIIIIRKKNFFSKYNYITPKVILVM